MFRRKQVSTIEFGYKLIILEDSMPVRWVDLINNKVYQYKIRDNKK